MYSTFAAGTNVGRRDNNEDSYACDAEHGLWLVADGVGGLSLGEVASAISTYTITRMVNSGQGVNQAIEAAHQQIKTYAIDTANSANMGCTIVLLLSRGSLYNIFWAGDCRAYLLEEGGITLLTVDHSHAQYLIDSGELTPEQAEQDARRNGITKALGMQQLDAVRADTISGRWKHGQKILLCSDGLSGCVEDATINAILHTPVSDDQKIDLLIKAALDAGGKDNITAILVTPSPAALSSDDDSTEVPANVDLNEFNRIP